jgi:hypothetical protein
MQQVLLGYMTEATVTPQADHPLLVLRGLIFLLTSIFSPKTIPL